MVEAELALKADNKLLPLRQYVMSVDIMFGDRGASSKGKALVAVDVLQGPLDT